MNKIITLSLTMCLLFSMVAVSAMEAGSVETKHYKQEGIVSFDYDLTLDNECDNTRVTIFDKDNNIVGKSLSPRIFCLIDFGYRSIDTRRTGTFEKSYEIQLVSDKNIKRLNNLRYEITIGNELLDSGKVIR